MTYRNVIENKISDTKKYLKILKNYQKFSQKKIIADINLRGALERYLYLACQSCIDLADGIIAFKQFRKPTTYRDHFDILFEEGLISQALAEKMIDMTKFRNVIAHDYTDLDYSIVYDVLLHGTKDIEKFVRKIEQL